MVILSVVHVLNLRTMMLNIVISFSVNYTTTTKIYIVVIVNTIFCQMKCYYLPLSFTLLLEKNLAFEVIINDMRSITKSDRAIQFEPKTYYNISPVFVVFMVFFNQLLSCTQPTN